MKNPALPGLFANSSGIALFDLGFLVDYVLADHGVEFPDFHLFRHVALVLGGGVVMAGSGAGNEFDFITHAVIP
jgi:hypothetical protein